MAVAPTPPMSFPAQMRATHQHVKTRKPQTKLTTEVNACDCRICLESARDSRRTHVSARVAYREAVMKKRNQKVTQQQARAHAINSIVHIHVQ